jgi:hypothetical protein
MQILVVPGASLILLLIPSLYEPVLHRYYKFQVLNNLNNVLYLRFLYLRVGYAHSGATSHVIKRRIKERYKKNSEASACTRRFIIATRTVRMSCDSRPCTWLRTSLAYSA